MLKPFVSQAGCPLNQDPDSRDPGRWWTPYLGVLLIAAAIGLLLLVFVVFHAEEIGRVLRASSSQS